MKSIQKFSWAASGACAMFAMLLILLAIIPTPRADDHHGGIYLLVLAMILLPMSAYFFLIGVWFRKSWPGKWLVLIVPAAAFVGFIVSSLIGIFPPI